MGALIERLALALIARGVTEAIAWALASDAVGSGEAPAAGGDCGESCALARCRMRSDPRIEDDCYAWDEPKGRYH